MIKLGFTQKSYPNVKQINDEMNPPFNLLLFGKSAVWKGLEMKELKQQDRITALYLRLSREDEHGGGDSSSIQTQRIMLSQYAKDNGLLNCEFYVDDGASGTTFERENFQRMVSDIEDGKVSCVVTKDLSRLGRNYLEAGRYRELFAEYGLRYIAISDGYDSLTDDGGDIATPIKEIIHEFYARDCSRKLKAAFKTKAENGGIVLGTPAYGYVKIEGTTNRLTPDENAPTVKRMFQMALEGKSCTQIANILCKENILIPQAYRLQHHDYDYAVQFPYKWAPTTVRGILSNPVYTGKLVLRRRTPKSFKDKTVIRQPKGNWIFNNENTHEALVSEDDFETVQERIKSKQRAPQSEINIFRGMVFCVDCGRRMGYSTRKGRKCG
jgi:DNA invertase Pin-like site-specific DNA recombinase